MAANILKREYAPITDQAWQQIEEAATGVITQNCAARKIVDLSGPHGWEFSSITLGRLEVASNKSTGGVKWGVRKVMPLMELRIPFQLSKWELDNINRGSGDPELGPVQHAAEQIARFEDSAIFHGFDKACIVGMLKSFNHKAVKLPKNPEEYAKAVSTAVKMISLGGVEGPYSVILGPDEYFNLLQTHSQGFPPHKVIQEMTGGEIIMCPSITGGAVVSARGGDFELTVGQDFSIGYEHDDNENVELYLTESFTYRTLDPAAGVALSPAASK